MNTTVSLELSKAQAFCLFQLLAKQVYDRTPFVPSQAQTGCCVKRVKPWTTNWLSDSARSMSRSPNVVSRSMGPNPAFNADPQRRAFGRAGWAG